MICHTCLRNTCCVFPCTSVILLGVAGKCAWNLVFNHICINSVELAYFVRPFKNLRFFSERAFAENDHVTIVLTSVVCWLLFMEGRDGEVKSLVLSGLPTNANTRRLEL